GMGLTPGSIAGNPGGRVRVRTRRLPPVSVPWPGPSGARRKRRRAPMTSTPATTGPIAPEADDGRRRGPQTQQTEQGAVPGTAPGPGSEVEAARDGGGAEAGDALPAQEPQHGDAHQGFPDESQQPPRPVSVLVYSDDADTRAAVRLAIGRRPAPDLPEV